MKKSLLMLIIFSPVSWFSFLISITLRMLHWRVVNEPGIADSKYIGLLIAHYFTFWIGLVLTLVIHILILKIESKKIFIAWVANAAATALYIPIFLITLLMMV